MPFAVEVLAFGDEEGVRFPVTLTGSRALAGLVQPDALEARDGDEVCLAQALRDFGCDPGRAWRGSPAIRPRVLGYLEVHIEQGRSWRMRACRWASSRPSPGRPHVVTVEGRAGHAGTVAMTLRRDGPGGGGEMVLAIEAEANGTPDLVATVGPDRGAAGRRQRHPGAHPVQLDLRSPSRCRAPGGADAPRRRLRDDRGRRGVTVSQQGSYDEPAAVAHPG